MRYMLLIYGDESRFATIGEAEQQAIRERWMAYNGEIRAAGVTQEGAALQSVGTATSVRSNGSGPLVTDGPFAETKEQLGGYYLLDVPDLDEAIKWAQKCPAAEHGTVELRPVMEIEQG